MTTKEEMKRENKIDDDIDLIELFKTIYKWKWFILTITTITVTVVIIMTLRLPQIYTSNAKIKVGRLSGVLIEEPLNVVDFYSSQNYQNELQETLHKKKYLKNFAIEKIKNRRDLILITASSLDPQTAKQVIDYSLNNILKRHKKIFNDSIGKLNDFYSSKNQKRIEYFISSYNYKTHILDEPSSTLKNKKLLSKSLIAFFTSFIISVILVFMWEFLKNSLSEEKSEKL